MPAGRHAGASRDACIARPFLSRPQGKPARLRRPAAAPGRGWRGERSSPGQNPFAHPRCYSPFSRRLRTLLDYAWPERPEEDSHTPDQSAPTATSGRHGRAEQDIDRERDEKQGLGVADAWNQAQAKPDDPRPGGRSRPVPSEQGQRAPRSGKQTAVCESAPVACRLVSPGSPPSQNRQQCPPRSPPIRGRPGTIPESQSSHDRQHPERRIPAHRPEYQGEQCR